jgi:hypothetical protein
VLSYALVPYVLFVIASIGVIITCRIDCGVMAFLGFISIQSNKGFSKATIGIGIGEENGRQ